jgi:hypothetical protein
MFRRLRLIVPALSLAAICTAVSTTTASAQGGGGGGGGGGAGGGGSTPSAPPTSDPCAPLTGTVYADATVAGTFNEYGITGGCAVIVFGSTFRATVYQVLPQPGWTYHLDIRAQSNGSRVTIEYVEGATGRVTSLLVEMGKTVVKQ